MVALTLSLQEAERKEHLVDDVPGAEDIETEAPIPDEHSGEMELPSKVGGKNT